MIPVFNEPFSSGLVVEAEDDEGGGGDGVQGGLRAIFPHLQSAENSELSFGDAANKGFASGFESTNPKSPTAPSHEWDSEKGEG